MGNNSSSSSSQQPQFNNYNAPQQVAVQPRVNARQDNLANYKDDEPVEVQDFRKNALKSDKKVAYDLEKGLSVEIKSMHRYFKFDNSKVQTIPIMVSLKTKEQEDTESSEESKTGKTELDANRANIDLICVIDNSGSMNGYKLENVRKALRYLLELLGENDRICLITFNHNASRLCPLQKNNKTNSSQINNAIASIKATGGTDINSGMEIALRVLKDRRTQNPVSSIFLLSDGQDGNAESAVKASISAYLPSECFTIHSFGFGSDHDAPMMNKICALKDGSFYYVEKIDQVDEFFVDALGGLFSVVAQDITLDININQSGPSKKFFSDATVSKTYGEMWKVISKNKTYQIKVNQLFSGVSKDYIFELTVPAKTVDTIEDFERNSELVGAIVSAISVDTSNSAKVVKEAKLILTLFTNTEQMAEDSEVNDAVEFNYLRVKASEAIEQAMKLAEKREYDNGQNLLQGMISNLDTALPANREKLNIIKRDLMECQTNSKPMVYEQVGKMKMQTKWNANMHQISQAVEANDLYQNRGQERFVTAARFKKYS